MSAYLLIVILNLFGTHNIQDASSTYSANNKPFFEAETLIQKGIKSVFDELDADLDTFSWHNYNINSGRIDCSYLFDTVKIKLIDSSLNRFISTLHKDTLPPILESGSQQEDGIMA